MIKITWADINYPPFVGAMKKINSFIDLPPSVAYKFGKLTRIFQKEMEKRENWEFLRSKIG